LPSLGIMISFVVYKTSFNEPKYCCEKLLELDVDIKVCFRSASEVIIHALREVYPNVILRYDIESGFQQNI
jgi:hypothetical protein